MSSVNYETQGDDNQYLSWQADYGLMHIPVHIAYHQSIWPNLASLSSEWLEFQCRFRPTTQYHHIVHQSSNLSATPLKVDRYILTLTKALIESIQLRRQIAQLLRILVRTTHEYPDHSSILCTLRFYIP